MLLLASIITLLIGYLIGHHDGCRCSCPKYDDASKRRAHELKIYQGRLEQRNAEIAFLKAGYPKPKE